MKKGKASTVLLIIIFLAGLSLLLYPSIANYWNSVYSTHAITVYSERTRQLSEEEYTDIWEAARTYNGNAIAGSEEHQLSDSNRMIYEDLLNLDGNGIMGYIEIPTIDVTLPIYHGTSDEVLQTAVGHLEWTSLPVGGLSTHCVLSGHRGLPSAKLFTNLDKLIEGDRFMLRILDEVLTYEVDQILIVEPQNVEPLRIEENRDYCTLVTCTPYGINTHRLLVRGHRVENEEEAASVRIISDAMQIEPLIVSSIIAVPLLMIAIILMITTGKQRNRKRR